MPDFTNHEQHTFRVASLAGIFYPNEDVLIRSALQSFGLIQNPNINTRCIFAPHGSWYITGNALSAAYKSLIQNDENPQSEHKHTISKVVLLGRRHNFDDPGLYLSESDYFETPVGNLMIDKSVNEALISCDTLFELNDIPHLSEDATETHFPFIKFLFPEASFIPILTGGFLEKTMNILAGALKTVFKPMLEETLFIISSNSGVNIDRRVSKMQSEKFIALVKEKNGTELLRNYHEHNISACGTLAMAAMLKSGLLDQSKYTQIPYSDGSIIDIDDKTVHYTALNFSK
jgi:AmmeMemoRadiSam system protein B